VQTAMLRVTAAVVEESGAWRTCGAMATQWDTQFPRQIESPVTIGLGRARAQVTIFRHCGTTSISWQVTWNLCRQIGARVVANGSLVVKALGYEPEGRGLETRWGEILNLTNPSGRTRPWGLLSL
jgi:hypothetical protein